MIIIGLGLVAFLVFNNSSPRDSLDNLNHYLNGDETKEMCFLYEKAADSEIVEDSEDAFNREYIELTIDSEGNTTGIHNIIPFAKDSNYATFFGVSDGTFVNVVATANAEGQTWQEHRLYKIQDDALFVGYQPIYVPRYLNEHGVYMYEDITKIVFDTDEFFLSQVACESVDKTKVL